MWHQPRLLNLLADMLFAAGWAMLLALPVMAFMRMPFAPVRMVTLAAPLRFVAARELEEALSGRLRGNFFVLSAENVREALEGLPWVRRARVRRVWPDRLEITLEEQEVSAHWGDSGNEWVNIYGEVFAANPPDLPGGGKFSLPRLSGPPGSAAFLLRRYGESARLLARVSLVPVALRLSARQALEVDTANKMKLKLGRERERSSVIWRLERFIGLYPSVVAGRTPPTRVVDLRYPNGFSLYPAGARTTNGGRENE
ncbi:MAG: FtsQ-type POTRA domain-containing protein [Zoogloeaceae bacterium]|jgi:cell division protein FtsQ|nr:FtsQ-type POTRA domain-containing protein [Zoogloeaceae bacterium]